MSSASSVSFTVPGYQHLRAHSSIALLSQEIYGWFWICPGGGDACKYRHALPPGYVFKTKKQVRSGCTMPALFHTLLCIQQLVV